MPMAAESSAALLVALAASCAHGTPLDPLLGRPPKPASARAGAAAMKPFREKIEGTAVEFEMTPIPGGILTSADPNDPNATNRLAVEAFYIGVTEVTFDLFDVFVYSLDQPDPTIPKAIDGVTRPSKPYIPPDRGFGHAGYPAIGMSFKNATEFCHWLSHKTGKKYRLPSEAEWVLAARAGTTGDYFFEGGPTQLSEHAWFKGNAEGTTHPVGAKKTNPFGLHDILGNAVEWCVGADGKPCARGGSFRDAAEKVTCSARVLPSPSWNASDPQIPKSQWWLVDCAFIGFRVVREP